MAARPPGSFESRVSVNVRGVLGASAACTCEPPGRWGAASRGRAGAVEAALAGCQALAPPATAVVRTTTAPRARRPVAVIRTNRIWVTSSTGRTPNLRPTGSVLAVDDQFLVLEVVRVLVE